jgi:hypothetical protein
MPSSDPKALADSGRTRLRQLQLLRDRLLRHGARVRLHPLNCRSRQWCRVSASRFTTVHRCPTLSAFCLAAESRIALSVFPAFKRCTRRESWRSSTQQSLKPNHSFLQRVEATLSLSPYRQSNAHAARPNLRTLPDISRLSCLSSREFLSRAMIVGPFAP